MLLIVLFLVGAVSSVYTGVKCILFDFEGVAGEEAAIAPFLAASIAVINFQVPRHSSDKALDAAGQSGIGGGGLERGGVSGGRAERLGLDHSCSPLPPMLPQFVAVRKLVRSYVMEVGVVLSPLHVHQLKFYPKVRKMPFT